MYTVVYADILLAVNWIIDYFLLLGTAALAGGSATRLRLLLAGALGGLSTFVFLAPPLPLPAQLAYQLAAGTAILLVAFRLPTGGRLYRLRRFCKLWVWYFLLNTCYSGVVLAAMYWLSFTGVYHNNLAFYYDVSPLLLVGCILAMYALLRLLLLLFEKPQQDVIVPVTVTAAGQTLSAEVLVDTGFTAVDAMLAQPVLLLSYPDTLGAVPAMAVSGAVGAAAPTLQDSLHSYYTGARAGACAVPRGLRLIPLHTAAGQVLVPALSAKAQIAGRRITVTLAFSDQRFRSGQIQGLFGAQNYQMIGGC